MSDRERLADELCVFLECAFHNILYIREIYPASLFKKISLYNVPIFKCRHLSVSKYVEGIVSSLRPLLLLNMVDRVCLVVCRDDSSREPLEQFVFGMELMGGTGGEGPLGLESFLRSLLLKINVSESVLPTVSLRPTTFYVVSHVRPGPDADLQGRWQCGGAWVDADEEVRLLETRVAESLPLKTICTDSLKIQLRIDRLQPGRQEKAM